jgi:hypothetical protein
MNKTIPAESMKKGIAYFYLLSFCPPAQLADFKRSTAWMRAEIASQAGLKEEQYFSQALPEVCSRIVAFQQATREPEPGLVAALVEAARSADENPAALIAFKAQMSLVSALPGRAKPENRLHRNKGCRYCAAACQYGYFTLVSDPQFSRLQELFVLESSKPASRQTPLTPVYVFAIDHLLRLTGAQAGFCDLAHAANLAYCLLMLGMAKSRLAFPEAQSRLFQEASQEFVRRQSA